MDSLQAAVIAAEKDVDLLAWLERADQLVDQYVIKPFISRLEEVLE